MSIRSTSDSKAAFMNIQWETTTPVWQSLRACLATPCQHQLGKSILSPDSSVIYTITSMNNLPRYVFVGYNVASGAIATKHHTSMWIMHNTWDLKYYNSTSLMFVASHDTYGLLFFYDTVADTWGQTYQIPTYYATFIEGDTRNM